MSTGKVFPVSLSTTGTLGRLFQYSRVILEHWNLCVGTVEDYRKTREAVPVQLNTIGALRRLRQYIRVL